MNYKYLKGYYLYCILMFQTVLKSHQIESLYANITNTNFNWYQEVIGFFDYYHYYYLFAAIIYLPMIWISQQIMKNRQPFSLKKPLFIWNLLLSILSGIGSYYVLTWIYKDLENNSLQENVCDYQKAYANEISWYVGIFNITKILEWIDTIFLVLRKKKIIFLHWFHHLITFLYCWHSSYYSPISDVSGYWFAGINMFVHAVMYMYYGLSTIGIKIPGSILITIIQTLQMGIGIYILSLTAYCPDSWKHNWHGNIFAIAMYSVYLYLFTKLFIKKLPCKKKKE
jgi:elongation of very long chain fatty acids protein 6